ncbi:MAG: hypothetical protein OWV35_00710 [Firmicutes bacterium]|nr:hypothetical protein [Bacillota bacterium]
MIRVAGGGTGGLGVVSRVSHIAVTAPTGGRAGGVNALLDDTQAHAFLLALLPNAHMARATAALGRALARIRTGGTTCRTAAEAATAVDAILAVTTDHTAQAKELAATVATLREQAGAVEYRLAGGGRSRPRHHDRHRPADPGGGRLSAAGRAAPDPRPRRPVRRRGRGWGLTPDPEAGRCPVRRHVERGHSRWCNRSGPGRGADRQPRHGDPGRRRRRP